MMDDAEAVTIFGLGEAGTAIANTLVARGVEIHAYDPRDVAIPRGVTRHDDPVAATVPTTCVLAVTAAQDATQALAQAQDALPPGTLYADLSTAAPSVKRSLADRAAAAGLAFVDIALMDVVPEHGLQTPQLASGVAAERYAQRFVPLGAPVEVVSEHAGDASTRKLLRSVIAKSLTSAVVEGLMAAHAAGLDQWLWDHLIDHDGIDPQRLRRMIEGTQLHARRRRDEMDAASQLLTELGIDPIMATATRDNLDAVAAQGIPPLAPLNGAD